MVSKKTTRRAVRKGSRVARPRADERGSAPTTKVASVISALSAPKGATLAQLMDLTGWQMHSVRGVMSSALKKQRGLAITSTKTGAERIYRIETKK